MNTKNQIPLIHDCKVFPDDNSLYFDVTVQAGGNGETAVEFRTRFNLALALNHGQLLSALGTFDNLFEWLIKKPTQIALTEFMEGKFQRGLAAQRTATVAGPKAAPVKPETKINPVPGTVTSDPAKKVELPVRPVNSPNPPPPTTIAKPAGRDLSKAEPPTPGLARPEDVPVTKAPVAGAGTPEILQKAA